MIPDFHKTSMGKKFYEGDLPSLIKSINRLCEALEEQNVISEKLIRENRKEKSIRVRELNEAKLNEAKK
jgi:hypothetical protein